MSSKGWKDILGAVAPTLASALGGPLAGAAVQEISNRLLGKPDGSDDEITIALATGGTDALAKLREADHAFKIRMEELGIDLEKVHQGDRSSARDREVKTGDHWTLRGLAALVVGAFVAVVWQVVISGNPIDGVLGGTLIGYLSAKADQILSYYFGSSAGSAAKDKMLHNSTPVDRT